MEVKYEALTANVAKTVTFSRYWAGDLLVKNHTGGELKVCEGSDFVEANAYHIPTGGWQSIPITADWTKTPSYTLKAAVSGGAELSFGGDAGAMGGASDGVTKDQMQDLFDQMGDYPHTLAVTQGQHTTLTVKLTSMAGIVSCDKVLSSGSKVYCGDIITVTVTAESGYTASATVNGQAIASGGTFTVGTGADVTVVSTATAS